MSEAASALGSLVERGLTSAGEAMESTSTGRAITDLMGNKGYELGLTEEGRTIAAMDKEYVRYKTQALGNETQKLAAVRKWHQSDDAARNALPIKTAKMAEYHAHAVATGHPIQQVTQSILQADPENAMLTQRELMVKNEKLSRLAGLAAPGSFGSKFENVTPIIGRLRQSEDPIKRALGQRYADIVSNEVRDTREYTTFQGVKGKQSVAKVNMNQAFIAANKVYDKLEMPRIPLLDTKRTYVAQGEAERTVHRVLNTILIPFVAIPHIGQLFNPASSTPYTVIGKALLNMTDEDVHQTVEASHITANTLWTTMYQDILGETGKIAEWTKSPTVGKILYRSIHQPGFNFVRRTQLNMAATVGFHSAIYWAHNMVENGSKIAAARLAEMGLDPAAIVAQKGELTEEQLQKAIFHYTNNRMFFSKSIDDSLYQNRNPILRSAMMYRSFVNSQATFMQREFMLMLKAGDLKGLAQAAGTFGILFAGLAAPLIDGLEVMARTGSLSQGVQETEQRYRRYWHPQGIEDWASNFTYLLSHIGAAGMYFNFIKAMQANRLASALIGPMAGLMTTDFTDAYHAVFAPTKHGVHNVAPLERDLLKQTIPVIGSALSHEEVPPIKHHGSGSSRFRLRSFGAGRRRF